MKVGRITIFTALLLMLPMAAFAGPVPCMDEGGDFDQDTVCDDVDNCTPCAGCGDTANPLQTDTDGDGRGDVCDNCTAVDNGPDVFVGALGAGATSQCDKDSDGYGNICDADFDNNGVVNAVDTGVLVSEAANFFATPPGEANLNCGIDNVVNALDTGIFVGLSAAFLVGPSGWSCAGTLGGCPPAP